jgi:hypothetical protein
MTRAARSNHSALLLEGPDDLRIYENFVDSECIPFPLDGRDQVVKALAVLHGRNQKGVAGIIDADCDYLNQLPCLINIVRTDMRDLEATLVRSPALEKLVHENIPASQRIPDLRERLINCCKDLGYLRCAVLNQQWHISFEGIEYSNFIDGRALTSNRIALCREVLRVNMGFGRTAEELSELIRSHLDINHNDWHVVCGHDLTAVIALWIRTLKGWQVTTKIIESQLRLAYEAKFFTATELYRAMRAWEAANKPYKLIDSQI